MASLRFSDDHLAWKQRISKELSAASHSTRYSSCRTNEKEKRSPIKKPKVSEPRYYKTAGQELPRLSLSQSIAEPVYFEEVRGKYARMPQFHRKPPQLSGLIKTPRSEDVVFTRRHSQAFEERKPTRRASDAIEHQSYDKRRNSLVSQTNHLQKHDSPLKSNDFNHKNQTHRLTSVASQIESNRHFKNGIEQPIYSRGSMNNQGENFEYDRISIQSQIESVKNENKSIQSKIDRLNSHSRRGSIKTQKESIYSKIKSLKSEMQNMKIKQESLKNDQESIHSNRKSLISDKDSVKSRTKSLKSESQSVKSNKKSLNSERQSVHSNHDSSIYEQNNIKITKTNFNSTKRNIKRKLDPNQDRHSNLYEESDKLLLKSKDKEISGHFSHQLDTEEYPDIDREEDIAENDGFEYSAFEQAQVRYISELEKLLKFERMKRIKLQVELARALN